LSRTGAVADAQRRRGPAGANPGEIPLVARAFVHGLVMLVQDGAPQAATNETDTALLAHRLTGLFADRLL
jgi:hypothetical protein